MPSWIDLDDLAISGRGLVEPPEGLQRVTQVLIDDRRQGIELQGSLQVAEALLAATLAAQQSTEPLVCAGVVWIQRDCTTEHRLGAVELFPSLGDEPGRRPRLRQVRVELQRGVDRLLGPGENDGW